MKPDPRKNQAFRALGCCIAILVAMFGFHSNVANATEPYKFDAMDVSWIADDLEWVQIEGKWLAATNISVASTFEHVIPIPELLQTLCTEILQTKPGAPSDDIAPSDIFRVNINVFRPGDQPAWPFQVPIPVSDGTCRVNDGSKNYFPTYPGRLVGWRFFHIGIQQMEGTNRMQWNFERDEDTDEEPGDFDFLAACEAARVDPSVLAMQKQFHQLARDRNIELQPDAIALFVKYPVAPGKNYGAFAGSFFDISSGACVETESR